MSRSKFDPGLASLNWSVFQPLELLPDGHPPLLDGYSHGSLLVRKLRGFIDLSSEELRSVAELESRVESVKARRELLSEGQSQHECYVLMSGWACSYKTLYNGRRQIINFALPGDFLGLQSCLLHTPSHSIVTLTPARVSRFPSKRVLEILHDEPRLGTAILATLSRDEAIVFEHLANLGRRKAVERMAHLFLELERRLRLVGLGDESGFDCPLTQDALADALGLTAVHVSRVLRELRRRGLLSLVRRRVVIHDPKRLADVARFASNYLD